MNKGTHFIGQPVYGQLINLLDREKIIKTSRENGGERYVKGFDIWQHLAIMLYAVIKRYDSLREITGGMLPEARKLAHLGISLMPRRSTLSDANARRPERIFEAIYRDLYGRYRKELSSDSRGRRTAKWMHRLQILDSTTITLFSNLIFKGAGRHPKRGKKKGGIKVHAVINANEGVPCDVRFTSAATNDSFMLAPSHYSRGSIVAMDRAYINYSKFEELTRLGVTYVTKMKKNLTYQTVSDVMHMDGDGLMEYRIQHVVFTKHVSDGEDIEHHARIITYVDLKGPKPKLVSLLTNDMELQVEDIVEIYRQRWSIELLFKQLKQNFPLRYFYGESANAIKIQIWVTLIANLMLMVLQRRIKRPWSFSGLATMVKNMLMYYVNVYTFFEEPEKDWLKLQENQVFEPPEPSLFPEFFN
jgi:transposase